MKQLPLICKNGLQKLGEFRLESNHMLPLQLRSYLAFALFRYINVFVCCCCCFFSHKHYFDTRTPNAPNTLDTMSALNIVSFFSSPVHFHRSSIFLFFSQYCFSKSNVFFFLFMFFFYFERIWEQTHLMRPPKRLVTITHTFNNIKYQASPSSLYA